MPDLDNATKTAMLNAVETSWGSGVYAKVFTGTRPANTTDADSGTALSNNIALSGGADWLTAPSAGVATTQAAVDFTVQNGGTPGYVRFYDASNVCRRQVPVDGVSITVTPAGALVAGAPARLGVLNFRIPV